MLVLLSDIHLSDGTTASNVAAEAFNILKTDIIEAYTENHAKELHLVLLGDIIDLVRSTYWIDHVKWEDRPWNGEFNLKTFTFENTKSEEHYKKILEAILNPLQNPPPHISKSSAPDLIRMCKELNDRCGNFRITYVVGNHDQAINCYSSLQKTIKDELAFMGNKFGFSHNVHEPEYAMLARHGHEFDSDCYSLDFYNKVLKESGSAKLERFDEDSYKILSIGEVITAEFMSGLLYYIYEGLKKDDPADMKFFNSLKDVNNVRPMKNSFEWLLWFIGKDYHKYEKIIEEALIKSTEGVYKSKFGKSWDKVKIWDQTDMFWALNKIVSLGSEKILRKIAELIGGSDDSAYTNAAMEEFKNYNDINYVFYGHTHNAMHKFAGGSTDGKSKLYVNTGTYLPFIDRADDNSFASAYQMTMIFVYKTDEDCDIEKGDKPNSYPTLDLWNGIKRKKY